MKLTGLVLHRIWKNPEEDIDNDVPLSNPQEDHEDADHQQADDELDDH
jgi:hypothetical protein